MTFVFFINMLLLRFAIYYIFTETPDVQLLLDNGNNIKAVHTVECRVPSNEAIKDMTMWINVNGKHLPQLLKNTINPDNKTINVFTKANFTFKKTDNQREVSCGVKWRNKVYTSDTLPINVLCKFLNKWNVHCYQIKFLFKR